MINWQSVVAETAMLYVYDRDNIFGGSATIKSEIRKY